MIYSARWMFHFKTCKMWTECFKIQGFRTRKPVVLVWFHLFCLGAFSMSSKHFHFYKFDKWNIRKCLTPSFVLWGFWFQQYSLMSPNPFQQSCTLFQVKKKIIGPPDLLRAIYKWVIWVFFGTKVLKSFTFFKKWAEKWVDPDC